MGPVALSGAAAVVMALGTILVALSIVLLVVADIFRRRGLRRAGQTDAGGFL